MVFAMPPAKPPESRFVPNDCQKCVLLLYLGNNCLMASLKAKAEPCCGAYRMQFTRFPRQNAAIPCSEYTRLKQSPRLVYRCTFPEMTSGLESCVCIRSFTRSIGDIAVFVTAPLTPPMAKSV